MFKHYASATGLFLTIALTGCSSGGTSSTEFSARNADGSMSLLHAHGVAASDDSTKLGRVCWYEARVFDKDFDVPMLTAFSAVQSRTFLMSKSYARPLTKYAIDCRLGIEKLKVLVPGVDVSKICSLGSATGTALTVADAPAAFDLQSSSGGGCGSMCTLHAPESYKPVFQQMGPSCSASLTLDDTASGPQFNFLQSLIGPLAGLGSSMISSGASKRCYKTHGDIAKRQAKSNDKAVDGYTASYGNYSANSQAMCNKCQESQSTLATKTSDLFGNIMAAVLMSPTPGFGLDGTSAAPASGSGGTTAATESSAGDASQFPEVDTSKFGELKKEMAKMGAVGPSGASACPEVPQAILELNRSSR